MTENRTKVGVIGIGNVLMGDDAAGPYLIKLLKARCVMPKEVELLDAGTAGLALPGLLEDFRAVLLVDTVRAAAAPGTVLRYDRAALLSAPRSGARTPHDPGLRDALLLAELGGIGPEEAVLIGVVPGRVDGGIGLSPAVSGAMDTLMDAVIQELARLGVSILCREDPPAPDLWWERPAEGAPL